MGQTGSGKSTVSLFCASTRALDNGRAPKFIKTITGSDEVVIGDRLRSGTVEAQSFVAPDCFDGKRLVLVDTPGTGAADMRDSEVLAKVISWLTKT